MYTPDAIFKNLLLEILHKDKENKITVITSSKKNIENKIEAIKKGEKKNSLQFLLRGVISLKFQKFLNYLKMQKLNQIMIKN